MQRDRILLPSRVEGGERLVLRRWEAADAQALGRAISESTEHLRPWMAWIADEPLALERRHALIEQWNRKWREGGDVFLGVFLGNRIVGGCGLHRRLGPGGLEIGYWTHASFLRRALATMVAELLTDAALGLPDVDYVEVHHDKSNQASAGIPRKLGFQLLGEEPDEPEAPAD